MKRFLSTPLFTLACLLSSSLAQNSTEPTTEPTIVPTASPVQTVEPTTSEPTEIPETEEPTTASPTLIPTTAEPSLQPTTVQPTTAEPTVPEETEAPTSSSPTTLPTAAPLSSIYEIISNSTPTLAFLVSTAGLEGTLSDPDTNYTLFSPLESAFAALPNEIALYLLGNVDTVLSPLLLGHVLPFVAPASVVVSLDGEEVEFANGVSQTITVTGNEVSLSAGGDDFVGTAKVVSVDIFARNGVIHEIDRILGVPTIFEFLGATQYAALLGAISVSGLSGELAMASGVTLFAPTTSGFLSLANEYPDLAGVVLDDPGFQLHAADMVLAHMVPNSVAFSGDLADGDVLTMANGENVTVVISNGNVGISPGSVNGIAPVSAVDGVTTQGVVHTLSGVIVPSYLTKTVVDIAVTEAPTAAELVIQAGLDTTLAEGFPFTLFLPNDAAFGKLPPSDIEFLKSEDGKDSLTRLLLYHAVGASVPSILVSTGSVTTLADADIDIVVSAAGVEINGESMVTKTDILASNGVVHIIDTVLIPPPANITTPEPTDVPDAAASVSAAIVSTLTGLLAWILF